MVTKQISLLLNPWGFYATLGPLLFLFPHMSGGSFFLPSPPIIFPQCQALFRVQLWYLVHLGQEESLLQPCGPGVKKKFCLFKKIPVKDICVKYTYLYILCSKNKNKFLDCF